MFTFLLILLVIDALILIPVVLLQSGKGGGLAAMGGGAGTDTLFGSRQATTILHKASWWAGGVFIALAFVLSILSSRPGSRESILRGEFQRGAQQAPASAPSNATGLTQPAAPATGTTPAPAAGTTAPAPGATTPAPAAATPPAGGTAPANAGQAATPTQAPPAERP